MDMQPYNSLWAQIDLDAVAFNTQAVKKIIGPNTRLLAVVKNNAYGHGIVKVGQTVLKYGADFLGVSTIEEGVQLRKHGIEAPVLIFTPFLPEEAQYIMDYRFQASHLQET
jgi:alanine racemase